VGRLFFLWVIVSGFGSVLQGQLLDVRLDSGRNNFILNEQVIVSVSIRNNTDQLAVLANEKDWIQFTVTRGKGIPVPKQGDPSDGDVFILKSGDVISRDFRLDSFFDFSEPGEYTISAFIVVPNWGKKKIEAFPTRFQVMRAHDVAVLERGVSSARGGLAPEVRRYTLQKARINGKLFMYAKVSDNNNPNFKVYNVMALGTMIQMPRPDIGFEIDGSGVVHVFFQCHARNFIYCTIDPGGELLGRQMYAGDNVRGRPLMRKTIRGGIEISGGQRVVSVWDFPAARRRPGSLPAKQLTPPR
jgi:hypothetical protein